MKNFYIFLKKRFEEKGQGMVEYGILLAFVLVIGVSIYATKNTENSLFSVLSANIENLLQDIETAFNY